jgi:SAM-dependent methyltransferase
MVDANDAVTPQRILQMAWGFAAPLAIEAAVRHKVFDVLAEFGPLDLGALVRATGASQRGVAGLANLLVGFGLLDRTDSGAYTLTPESRTFLVSGRPEFQGGLFRHMSGQLIPVWSKLADVVATGVPALAVNQKENGSAFFEEFVADLFPMNYLAARALAAHLHLAEASVLDLAAGSGVWGIALAQSSPGVRVRAVDWPQVLDVTRDFADRFGLRDRYTFAQGDLSSADFGGDHTVAVLGHILHSEGEERSRALLQRTFDALGPGGTIAIAEFLVDADRKGPLSGLVFAVNMLVNTDCGNTYSFDEIGLWLGETGFRDMRQLDAPGPSPLILATKPA